MSSTGLRADSFSQERNRRFCHEGVYEYVEGKSAIIIKGADFSAPFIMVILESSCQN